ncbi:hypothetical protein VOLCADRAFT_102835 [Volvox carteri f. nagariensis]|uniref:Protein kinase domain-containing protein n=1 Tax=Volvox carteri f. nagariensis TaxID=3068 RepID=D8TIE4_VOLCA|nr:uncharacterized protein VOLCADRAFT_102835 [Volvox carteri f. nagariensis]EFJ52877.1 hypothetical protein VOLCADRAFT_102835 [Volvox carteri f. nagariensis]|eukprot:XP_002945882.1 hypothetical protein VOLCADRAFT_102835 [Volvox carteri f. nagariensis]
MSTTASADIISTAVVLARCGLLQQGACNVYVTEWAASGPIRGQWFCLPTILKLHSVKAVVPPAKYPHAQQLVELGYQYAEGGCRNGSSVPPLQRCWPDAGLAVEVAGEGIRIDPSSDQSVSSNTIFYLQNAICLCEHPVSIACLTEPQVEPMVCFKETMRQFENVTTSFLDDYRPDLQLHALDGNASSPQVKQTQRQDSTPPPASGAEEDQARSRAVVVGAAVAGTVVTVSLFALMVAAAVRSKRLQENCKDVGGSRATMNILSFWTNIFGRSCLESRSCNGPASELNITVTAYENGSGVIRASSATPPNHHPKSGESATAWLTSLTTAARNRSPLHVLPWYGYSAYHPTTAIPEVAVEVEEVQPGEQQVVDTEPTVVTPLEQAAVVITPDTRPQPNLKLCVRLMDPAADVEAGDSSNSPTAGAVTGLICLHSKEEEVSGSGSDSAGGGPPCHGSNVVELSPVVRGKGTFGRVVEGTYRGQRVAVKLLASEGPWGCPIEAFASSFAQEVQSALVGSQVLHIAISIANALAYLHPTISHRDLKPANVLLNDPHSDLPTVKLTDFGLSRLRVTVAPTEHPDAGTPAYMAPCAELSVINHRIDLRGRKKVKPECFDLQNRQVTHKADTFSLGVLLWEMLACKRPWTGLNPLEIGVMVALNGMRPPLDELLVSDRCPLKLCRLLLACWEMDPDRRPAAAETVKELALILQGQQLQFKQQLVQSVLDRTGQEGGGGPCLQPPTAPRAEFTAAAAADARDGDVAPASLAHGPQQLCDCGAVEDELHVFEECPAYKSIRAKYDGDLVFKGRSMRTIMTEAPPLALASDKAGADTFR